MAKEISSVVALSDARMPSSSIACDIPTQWFNLLNYLPERLPEPRDPEGASPSRIEVMGRIRLKSMLAHDRVTDPWIDIPAGILDRYEEIGRPTPLMRARRLERYLDTPARIFIKREDLLPTGSFKLNSSIAQAYYAAQEGIPALVTETGAGQWGHAVAYACRLYDIKNVIFWADVSAKQKKERGTLIRMLGGIVHASPSAETEVGKTLRERGTIGSLGTAIGEAIAFAASNPDFRYISGSNHPHVLLHQSVIGLETRKQLEGLGEAPDKLVACVGGGSNLGGFMGPFLPEKMQRGNELRMIAAEADTAPRLTKGEWRYDHADPIGVTPLTKSYTLGRDFHLPETHVGGLRQHNGSPVVGLLRKHGIIEACAYAEREIFEAGRLFLRQEGILAAPESCHALRAAIDHAVEARRFQRKDNIVCCMSGSGVLDLAGYAAFC
jgi:pyridoxal-phosphate dependent TrpB-like enzyme